MKSYIWIHNPDYCHGWGIEIVGYTIDYKVKLILLSKQYNMLYFVQGENQEDQWLYVEYFDGENKQQEILNIIQEMLATFPNLTWIDQNEFNLSMTS